MTKNIEILSYARYAVAYLLSSLSLKELKNISHVILFGSVARLTANEESDVDIFFDVSASNKQQQRLKSKLNKLSEYFYLTNIALEYKSKGIDNELSIKVGALKEWESLSHSISSHGILLHGKYLKAPTGLKAYTVLSWENPGKAKGALLNKLYGYKSGNKKYPGMLDKYKSTKIGGSTILVPGTEREKFIEVLEKYNLNYSQYDIWK